MAESIGDLLTFRSVDSGSEKKYRILAAHTCNMFCREGADVSKITARFQMSLL